MIDILAAGVTGPGDWDLRCLHLENMHQGTGAGLRRRSILCLRTEISLREGERGVGRQGEREGGVVVFRHVAVDT